MCVPKRGRANRGTPRRGRGDGYGIFRCISVVLDDVSYAHVVNRSGCRSRGCGPAACYFDRASDAAHFARALQRIQRYDDDQRRHDERADHHVSGRVVSRDRHDDRTRVYVHDELRRDRQRRSSYVPELAAHVDRRRRDGDVFRISAGHHSTNADTVRCAERIADVNSNAVRFASRVADVNSNADGHPQPDASANGRSNTDTNTCANLNRNADLKLARFRGQ